MTNALRWTTAQLDAYAKRRKQRLEPAPSPDVAFETSMQREERAQRRAEVVNTDRLRSYEPKARIAGRIYPLVLLCAEAGLPEPFPEYRFDEVRGWRFDYAHVAQKIATEVEGGIWMRGGGGHSHPMHILRDMEKYNRAAVLGWRVIRVVPEKIGDAIPMLREMLR